ncbi:hypothetical protein CsSME_00047979 [Camellia sinensis var. sinensis]
MHKENNGALRIIQEGGRPVISVADQLLPIKMADDIPYGGDPPYAEDEPDIIPLPLRIRPFDLEEYDPEEHILPPSTFYHFMNFVQRAPADLLLRELKSHLSHHAHESITRDSISWHTAHNAAQYEHAVHNTAFD